MSSNTIDRLAVVFTAIEGTQSDGDAAEQQQTLQRLQGEQRDLVEAYDGEFIDVVGSELLLVFPSPDAALNCACRMQQTLQPTLRATALRLTVGLHFGVVYRKGTNVFGDSVNTAARIKSQCPPERIVASQAFLDVLHDQSRSLLSPFDRIEVKGKVEPLRLYDVVWAPEDLNRTSVIASMIDTGYLRTLAANSLCLDIDGRSHELTAAMTPVTLGRGEGCDLPVDHPSASRLHCRIEHRRGKFLLVDCSTNGTHILRPDGTTTLLKREEAVLTGTGSFTLGSAPGAEGVRDIDFETT